MRRCVLRSIVKSRKLLRLVQIMHRVWHFEIDRAYATVNQQPSCAFITFKQMRLSE